MPTYSPNPTAPNGIRLNRRWIAFLILLLVVIILFSLQHISLSSPRQNLHTKILQSSSLPDHSWMDSGPVENPVKKPVILVSPLTSPTPVVVQKSPTPSPSPSPSPKIEKYSGPPLSIEQVHKKTAKLLYGQSVAHETEEEKKQIIPLSYLFDELYRHGYQILPKKWEPGQYGVAGEQLRTFSQLYAIIFDRKDLHPSISHIPNFPKAAYLIRQLERKLFPWMNKKYDSLNKLRESWSGKGIVLTSGKWHFPLAIHAILSLRMVLNVTLPIEIFYSGKGDTEDYMVKLYQRIKDVRVIDVDDYFHKDMAGIDGWHVKPFAMLASRFREIVFLDADVLFFQDPGVTFNFDGYNKTGTTYFFDRSIGHGRAETHIWFEEWMKDPTEVARKARFWNHDTIHEMESGVVAIDKQRAYMQLLSVCWMNTKQDRDIAMKHVHGDKETFWMVAELLRLPYYFAPTYGGTVGYKNQTDNFICGGLFHTDEKERPFWWNGGVLMNKHFHRDEYIEFTHYAYDKTTHVEWKWETEHTPFCLMPKNPREEIGELSTKDREAASQMVAIYKFIQEIGVEKGKWEDVMQKFNL